MESYKLNMGVLLGWRSRKNNQLFKLRKSDKSSRNDATPRKVSPK